MFYYTGIRDTHFETSLKINPDVNRTFVENFQNINPKNWNKIHDETATYIYQAINYVGTSVAEIAERNLVIPEVKGLLLNFSDSQFANNIVIDIIKNNNKIILIDCAYDPDSINNWLVENNIINPAEIYDEESRLAPLDMQTVLRDNSKFERTTILKIMEEQFID